MSEYIIIKSKALSVYDYKNVDISEYVPEFKVDEAQLQKDISRILSAHGKKESAEYVSAGDQAEISCTSANNKFNREKVFIMVGKGLYSKELEDKIVGMKKGETKEITVGEDNVCVCVRNIIHTVLPELTDDNVASFEIEDVHDVAGLRRYCIDKQITRFFDEDESADMAAAAISKEIMSRSTFELDEEELRAAYEMGLNRFSNIISEYGDVTDDKYLDEMEVSVSELRELMKDIFVSELRAAAIGYAELKEKNALLTVSDYDILIARHSEAAGVSVEEGKRQYPLGDYAREQYAEYFLHGLDEYIDKTLKRAMNP